MYEAYKDLKYLLNRGYRKSKALEFVCNHYLLPSNARHLLARCVFPTKWIEETKRKLASKNEITGKEIGIDGFNVLITLDSVIRGEAFRCEDGIVRDIRYIKNYKFDQNTLNLIRIIADTLSTLAPEKVIIFYGKSTSKSGRIAELTKKELEKRRIKGEVKVVKSPDFELKKFDIVATGDVGIIEKVKKIFDIPAYSATLLGIQIPDFKDVLKIFDEKLK
ncbi:hypothetical protein PFC_10245 [Pyrococcus furiosus COM1]|uniref:DUF434 domain-containing protein n=1 Tax=Pyrococcus furiosus COM1 TaxID=1185654 RepID=I6V439_9EURY|nr:hypothetical protein PFC_10245 [Pyrococcus furiosus COM1]